MSLNEIELLKGVEILESLGDKDLEALTRICELITVSPKDRICKAGEKADGLYFILDGSIRLTNESVTGNPILVDTLREGSYFGEDSLFSDSITSFSIYGDSASTILLHLSSARFSTFLKERPGLATSLREFMAHNAIRNFLRKSAVFRHVPDDRLAQLITVLKTKELEPGQFLIRQGEKGKEAYIVKNGKFRIYSDESPDTATAFLRPGDLAGEIALIKDVRRTMNVVAETRAEVFIVPKKEFIRLLEEQEDLGRFVDNLVKQRLEEIKTAGHEESDKQPKSEANDVVPPIVFKDYRQPLKYRLGNFPAVRQQSIMDCGAACLATICSYYGKKVSLNHMRELTRVGRAGASMLDLCKAADELGFETIPVLSTIEHLAASYLPAIVNWNGYHWIVVYRITASHAVVADPEGGLKKIPIDEFIDGWTRYAIFLKPTEKVKDIEESKPTLEQFRHYVKPFGRLVYEIALASLLIQILSMFMPVFTKFIIDDVIIKQNRHWFFLSIIAISCLVLTNLIMGYCRQNLLLSVSFKVSLLMVSDFYKQLLSLPLTFFEKRKVGDITSRFQENENITDFMTNTGVQIFLNMITALMYLVLMFYFNVMLSFVACGILFLNVFVVYFVTPRLQHSYRDAFQKNADSESFLIESVNGWSTIKILGIESITRWVWENLYVSFTNAYFKTIKYGMVSGVLTGLVNNLGDVAVLFAGALMVLKGGLTVGELVAFTVLVKGVSSPINQLVGSWDTFQEALNSVERMNDVLEARPEATEEEEKGKIEVPPLRGHVMFEDITFRYEHDAKTNILQNISLEVEPGQRIAFVGRSGSGKSTLIKLLLGFYPPSSGRIYIDGFDLRDVKMQGIRSQIGVVPQQSYLFKGRIRDNIAKTSPAASMREIVEAARLAGAHDFIKSFPQGYDTILEEQGANLSGGQRQRICIARMFLQHPSILVLDEATSALDNESERFVQKNIDSIFQGRSVFIIAHRLSTIRNCDRIVVIDKGNILEQGSHEELIEQKGLYFFLSTQQLNL